MEKYITEVKNVLRLITIIIYAGSVVHTIIPILLIR